MSPARDSPARALPVVQVVVLGVVVLGIAAVVVVAPAQYGVLLTVGAIGVVAVVLGLASPALAAAYLLVATFLRLALPATPLPTDPFLLAFVGLLLAVAVRSALRLGRSVPVGGLGVLVGLYLAWNVWSAVAGHDLPAAFPIDGTTIDVPRFVLIGTVMPLTVLLVAIAVLGRPSAIRTLVATTLGLAGYSALVTLLQFHGPAGLIWPGYAAGNPDWPGRATGVVDQPVVHGLLLTIGYLVAVMVASHPRRSSMVRGAAALLAAACCYSVYLTFTRSAWLCLALTVLLGALLARGWRTGFVLTGAAALTGVAATWATFISGDRSAGGVGSANEIHDRLNINITGVWATLERPVTGWGVGRFPAVNTRDHQQFSPDVPWERGFGLAAHNDLLAVSSELGLVGAGLWLAIVVLVTVRLARALRRQSRRSPADPDDRFVVVALLALVAWIVTGLTVDQRFLDVTNLLVMVLVGAALGRAAHRATTAPATRPTEGAEGTRPGHGAPAGAT